LNTRFGVFTNDLIGVGWIKVQTCFARGDPIAIDEMMEDTHGMTFNENCTGA
jgi:hypothetical protein